MTSWIETQQEIEKQGNSFDTVRRERIRKVEAITGRPLIVYASDFINREKAAASRGGISIDGNDKIGFTEVTNNIEGEDLDILIHSPGGDPAAAESIVELLRSRYKSLRFIVPDQAKSAATMICCAGDEILMDEKSELGPIDPQLTLIRADGVTISAPAQAIIDQFENAKSEIAKNPKDLPAWLPILQPLGPSLLIQCEAADKLSRNLVETWLKNYMFREHDDAEVLSKEITNYLADYNRHLYHGRRIGIEQLTEIGLSVSDLRNKPNLCDAIWNLYLSISLTFNGTNSFKIIENGHGGAFIRNVIFHKVKIPVPAVQQIQPQPISKTKRGRRGKSTK